MYEMAKSARDALKSKARRLAGADDGKVDATSVKRPAAFTAEKKTGKAPVNPRAYKRGGSVKRQEGGAVTNPSEVANAMEDLREAKVERPATRTLPSPKEAMAHSKRAVQDVPDRKHGGKIGKAKDRIARKSGGGVTVINIGKGASDAPMKTPTPPPVPMPMASPPPMQSQMPVQQPQMMPSPAARNAPLALKTGGRVSKVAKSYKDMSAGAGSGEGRLQKADIAKKRK